MAWEITPTPEVKGEVDRMGEVEFRSLISEVQSWVENGDWDDLALARGITDRGHSEDFSFWLVKEARMRDLDAHKHTNA
jgi:hypothetical protein